MGRRTYRGGLVASTPGVGILCVVVENRFDECLDLSGRGSMTVYKSLQAKKGKEEKEKGTIHKGKGRKCIYSQSKEGGVSVPSTRR